MFYYLTGWHGLFDVVTALMANASAVGKASKKKILEKVIEPEVSEEDAAELEREKQEIREVS